MLPRVDEGVLGPPECCRRQGERDLARPTPLGAVRSAAALARSARPATAIHLEGSHQSSRD